MKPPIHDIATLKALAQAPDEANGPSPINWERLAKFLIGLNYGPMCMQVSDTISRHVSTIRKEVGEKEAQLVANFFNANRSKFMQDFLG
jgi:hypothetical protein